MIQEIGQTVPAIVPIHSLVRVPTAPAIDPVAQMIDQGCDRTVPMGVLATDLDRDLGSGLEI